MAAGRSGRHTLPIMKCNKASYSDAVFNSPDEQTLLVAFPNTHYDERHEQFKMAADNRKYL